MNWQDCMKGDIKMPFRAVFLKGKVNLRLYVLY